MKYDEIVKIYLCDVVVFVVDLGSFEFVGIIILVGGVVVLIVIVVVGKG